MASGDIVFTSSNLDVDALTVEGAQETVELGSALVSGHRNQVISLAVKHSSVQNSSFDVTKQYVVEVKEA